MRHSSQCRAGLLFVCVLGLPLGACHHGPAAESAASQSVDQVPYKASGATAHSMASRTALTPEQNFASMVQALPAKEQTRVHDWYKLIGAPSMDDATLAQIAWMRARHYPMPADIARAESMSKAELKAAANTGDTTAQILYVARLLDEHSAHVQAAGASNKVAARLWVEVSETMRQILASGSPYAGYLFAAQDRLTHPDIESNAATQLAGLVWASKFGDTRADRLLNTPTVQAVNGTIAGAAISLMLTKAMYGNPGLFSTPVSTIPPSNH